MKDKFYMSLAPIFLTIASATIWIIAITIYLSAVMPLVGGHHLVSEWPFNWVVISMVLSTAAFFTSISLAAYQRHYKLSKEDLAKLIKTGYISMDSVSFLLHQKTIKLQSSVTYWDVFIERNNERVNEREDAKELHEKIKYKKVSEANKKEIEALRLFLSDETAKHGATNE